MIFLKWLVPLILSVGLDKLIGLLKVVIDRVIAFKKADAQAKIEAEPLKQAKTGEEVDAASSDILNRL